MITTNKLFDNFYYKDCRFCNGTIYFKDNDMIRILERNFKHIKIIHIGGDQCEYGKIEVIHRNVLKKKYIRLIPVGYIYIDVCKKNRLTPIEDIIVSYEGTAESNYYKFTIQESEFIISSYVLYQIATKYAIPSATVEMMNNNKDEKKKLLYQLSSLVVQDDIMDYDAFNTYNRLFEDGHPDTKYYLQIAVYLDDTEDKILSMIPKIYKRKYNRVLNITNKLIYDAIKIDISEITKDFDTFMKSCNIMDCIDYINSIYSLPFKAKPISKGENEYDTLYMMDDKAYYSFTYNLGYNIKEIILLKYWYDFDPSRVSSAYSFELIRNSINDELYIMGYIRTHTDRNAILRALAMGSNKSYI